MQIYSDHERIEVLARSLFLSDWREGLVWNSSERHRRSSTTPISEDDRDRYRNQAKAQLLSRDQIVCGSITIDGEARDICLKAWQFDRANDEECGGAF